MIGNIDKCKRKSRMDIGHERQNKDQQKNTTENLKYEQIGQHQNIRDQPGCSQDKTSAVTHSQVR